MPTKEEILAAYDMWDDDDISTERLLQLTADTCGCEITDVIDALTEK